MERHFFVCRCSDVSHQFVISQDPDDSELIYISIHLEHLPLWKRIKHAIRYILGKKSIYGDFDEIILDKSQVKLMINKLVYCYLRMNQLPK
jgi:hypothetical protein